MSEVCCGGTCERPSEPAHARREGLGRQVVRMSLAGALIAAGMAAAYSGFADRTVAVLSAMAAALTIGTPLRRAVTSLGNRVLDINVLMVVAVAGAAALGDWIEAATVVWLFGMAQWLESWSMARARRAIRSLADTCAIVCDDSSPGRRVPGAGVGCGRGRSPDRPPW